MMRGVPHNVTTEMNLALWQTAQAIRNDASSLARFEATDAAALAADYLKGSLPGHSQAAVDAFLQRYGARGLGEIDLGRPRWREDPTQVLRTLQNYLGIREADMSPDAVYERGRDSAEIELKRLADMLARRGSGWFKARLARWAARRMRALVGLRESPKFAIVRLLSVMREAMLASGQDLTEAGILDSPEDVFFLHLTELQRPADYPVPGWAALAEQRRKMYERERLRTQIPRLLLSDGSAFYGGVAGTGTEESGPTGPPEAIAGSPVSPGVVEGVVRVVFDPRQAELAPGEILVCPATDPSWTPLFLVAGGVVSEVGGMMTHGAVVAREYGIPAVVGVHQATHRLRTGQLVRVDGHSGTIVVLRRSARSGPGARSEDIAEAPRSQLL
jgi:pyruvate,water dikinase